MAVPPSNANSFLIQGFRLEQLGEFSRASEEYKKALEAQPDNITAATRYFRLRRDMRRDAAPGIKLVWQIDLQESWESQWVRHLLSGLEHSEVVDRRHTEFHDGAIVVDNRIGPEKRSYYFEMLKRGHRFALFHLSDEYYGDDGASYNFANLVLRNYWSRAHAADRNVIGVPLGLMNGFRVESALPTRARKHLWCFAGNIVKRSRIEMMAAMSGVGGGRVHGTNRVNPRVAAKGEDAGFEPPLDVSDYARLMSESVFAPCPAGWENLDSFRVCEALEAGCIPIVERRPSLDYFSHLFGEHPMLTVEDWNNAPALIEVFRADPAALDQRRLACANWWRDYKASLVLTIRDRIRLSLCPGSVSRP
jgi:hypothetical protein